MIKNAFACMIASKSQGCNFPREPDLLVYIFIFITLVFSFAVLVYAFKYTYRGALQFALLAGGILVFEVFTSPLWHNWNMPKWAYLYQDISWILTVGWAAIFFTVIHITDKVAKKQGELTRFCIYLLSLTFVVPFLESFLVGINIRSYAPEVHKSISGIKLLNVPVEILYYVPVFSALVISFYKYWLIILDDYPIVPLKKIAFTKTLIAACAGVLLFEIMIEPAVENRGMPEWSYIYKDVSIVMTGIWVLLLWITSVVVERFFLQLHIINRFLVALGCITLLALPLEAWYILNGYRVYSQSAVDNFSGIALLDQKLPIEVIFAIPFYFLLIIPFIRYVSIPWNLGPDLRRDINE